MKIKLSVFCILFSILNSTKAQTIVRGPYLQLTSDSSITIKWRTDIAASSKIMYGLSFSNQNLTIEDLNPSIDHSINLPGLAHETTYFYSVYGNGNLLEGSTSNYFRTPTLQGSEKKLKFWITGDCGTGTPAQTLVKNEFLNYVQSDTLDGWLLLGDNAYSYGLDTEYQARFFEPYQNDRIMKQTPILPCPGNHDYGNAAGYQNNQSLAYYQIFDLPQLGQLGGLPTYTEAYYSYNIGNVHFVSLDSYGRETAANYRLSDTLGPQMTWLKQDLATNTQKWTILYWHHPPYTMGSHNSDTETELRYIREKALPLIEQYHVDLILCGHSHNYERSKLMKGNFGLETTYDPNVHEIEHSSGFYDGSPNSCPYTKMTNAQNEGIIYVVAGAAGQNGPEKTTFPHDAMPFSNGSHAGSLYLEIEGDRLDSKWIADDGNIYDKFTIFKDKGPSEEIINLPKNATTLTLNSPDAAHTLWSAYPNQILSQIAVYNPLNGMQFHVKDSLGCFEHTFKIQIPDTCKQAQSVNNIIDSLSVLNVSTSETINASSVILNPTNSSFSAAKNIVLEPGFMIKEGIFEALIGGCVNN
ncbi:metallophosphoesterase family protein [Lacihabitans sp. LS3-19]|uniref:purple acid phosphatase family protein n=1 Tax=Lacihabitans sp. LS3-19 TaxID=2487335 RepID=UPI0020CE056C|nr:metallophosphoesterase family protein [Lacihabitans sp. LS3-19]MCP9767458.1 metallophosphoesterase family protein [Lacihabitans sp. LS3-19]